MKLLRSTFTIYELTHKEGLAGAYLTQEQTAVMQNRLGILAEMHTNLVPDAVNYTAFIQQEAHIKGQIELLRAILDESESAQAELLEIARGEASLDN